MDFYELIAKRYSVRAYKPDDVPEEILMKVLDAARLAPTAANRQPVQFVIIHTRGREEELGRIYPAEWFAQAPIVICACAVPSQGWMRWDGRNYCDVDVSIAMDHLILAAANEGLGTCWIGAFKMDATREILGLPSDIEPIAFTPLGYPADEPREKHRKPLDDMIRYERW